MAKVYLSLYLHHYYILENFSSQLWHSNIQMQILFLNIDKRPVLSVSRKRNTMVPAQRRGEKWTWMKSLKTHGLTDEKPGHTDKMNERKIVMELIILHFNSHEETDFLLSQIWVGKLHYLPKFYVFVWKTLFFSSVYLLFLLYTYYLERNSPSFA